MPVTTTYPYIQYGGLWTTSQATDAVASGTWPSPPPPPKSLYTWGGTYTNPGMLGLGNITNYSSPKHVGSLTNWAVTAANNGLFAAAVKSDGTLWLWGQNNYGQLGLGNTTNRSSPNQVGSLTNWLSVACGYNFTLSIKTDGTLWAWGQNNWGQLGLGNTTYYSSPKQVGALTTWLSVTGGYQFTFAIKTNGTLWAWGHNNIGQLGLGNTTSYYSSPKQVGALTNWLSVACGTYFTTAIKTDGTLWSWGNNGNGQLGLNDTANRNSPVQVGALNTWINVATGGSNVLAVKTNGTLWSWGRNVAGQLGLGNTTAYSSPKQIGALTNWSKPSAGGSVGQNVGVIKTDGTLWSWGANGYGQLGLGNTSYYSSPMQVGASTNWLLITMGSSWALGIST